MADELVGYWAKIMIVGSGNPIRVEVSATDYRTADLAIKSQYSTFVNYVIPPQAIWKDVSC